jgi:hypothetical protein
MPGVTQALRAARDLLLVANRDNPKALGDFGYAVDYGLLLETEPVPASPISAVNTISDLLEERLSNG